MKELLKDKIMIFVIGLLLGAVIATGAFYAYSKSTTCNNSNQQTQMNGGTPPSMPNEGLSSDSNSTNGQPPEKPSGENSTNEQPPEKPSDDNQNSSN